MWLILSTEKITIYLQITIQILSSAEFNKNIVINTFCIYPKFVTYLREVMSCSCTKIELCNSTLMKSAKNQIK